MVAYFKCIYGKGMVHKYTNQYDIESMRKHADYIEIDEAEFQRILKTFEPTKREKVAN